MRTAREKAAKQRETAAKDSSAEEAVLGQASLELRKAEEIDADDANDTNLFGRKRRKVNEDRETHLLHDSSDPAAPSGVPSPSIDTAPVAQVITDGDAPIMVSEAPRILSTARHVSVPRTEPVSGLSSVVLTKPSAEMRGHTSYLTFAFYHPAAIRQQLAVQEVSKGGLARLAELNGNGDAVQRGGSVETEFGSEGMDQVMGTLTEEEMVALAAKTK